MREDGGRFILRRRGEGEVQNLEGASQEGELNLLGWGIFLTILPFLTLYFLV